ncbi:MAG: hypothetical protein MJ230_05500 [bacterium]|nr:hypothetical protein [bacterium]
MSTAAIEKATLFLPIAVSSLIFAMRRIDKGVNAFSDNPLYGTANIGIAGGQTLKGVRAAEDFATTNSVSAAESIKNLNSEVKAVENTSKFMKGTKAVFDFISRNINPLIVAAETLKVFSSDDKADAAVRSILGLSCMFAGEGLMKRFIGMPYTEIKNGVRKTVNREALYHKNPFVDKQVSAFKDYCETKKLFNKVSLKGLPGATKALLFVGASIGSYAIGKGVANLLIGKEQPSQTTTAKAV